MKSISFTGFVLLAIALILFYFTTNNFSVAELKLSHLMGIMAGIGIGLIIGGMVGYVSKGSAIKEEQKRKEIAQLRREKEDLEKQAAALAAQQASQTHFNQETIVNKNPPNY